MRTLTKKNLEELAKTMPVIPQEDLLNYAGGDDCVLSCFAELSNYSVSWWVDMVESNYGYNVYSNGGLFTDDIKSVAGMGGLNVHEYTGEAFVFSNSTGKTSDWHSLIATFSSGAVDHAVIVTGISGTTVTYMDPQKNNAIGTVPIADCNFYGIY